MSLVRVNSPPVEEATIEPNITLISEADYDAITSITFNPIGLSDYDELRLLLRCEGSTGAKTINFNELTTGYDSVTDINEYVNANGFTICNGGYDGSYQMMDILIKRDGTMTAQTMRYFGGATTITSNLFLGAHHTLQDGISELIYHTITAESGHYKLIGVKYA